MKKNNKSTRTPRISANLGHPLLLLLMLLRWGVGGGGYRGARAKGEEDGQRRRRRGRRMMTRTGRTHEHEEVDRRCSLEYVALIDAIRGIWSESGMGAIWTKCNCQGEWSWIGQVHVALLSYYYLGIFSAGYGVVSHLVSLLLIFACTIMFMKCLFYAHNTFSFECCATSICIYRPQTLCPVEARAGQSHRGPRTLFPWMIFLFLLLH